MLRTRLFRLSLGAVVCACTFFGWKLTALSAYESAQYTVVESESSFEIREYPDLIVATTKMKKTNSQGRDGSFMRLFQYISGNNENDQKIAMTTPVFMDPRTKTEQGQMEFVMPKTIAESDVPKPSSEKVVIQKRVGGRFALIRFSGRMNTESNAQAEKKLRNWMRDKKLVEDAAPVSAGYDPPWTPGKFRRNEILIRLK